MTGIFCNLISTILLLQYARAAPSTGTTLQLFFGNQYVIEPRCPSTCYLDRSQADLECTGRENWCELQDSCPVGLNGTGYSCSTCNCVIASKPNSFGFYVEETCMRYGMTEPQTVSSQFFVTVGVDKTCMGMCMNAVLEMGNWCGGAAGLFSKCCQAECGGINDGKIMCYREVEDVSMGPMGERYVAELYASKFGVTLYFGNKDFMQEQLLFLAAGVQKECIVNCLHDEMDVQLLANTDHRVVSSEPSELESVLAERCGKCCEQCGGTFDSLFIACGA